MCFSASWAITSSCPKTAGTAWFILRMKLQFVSGLGGVGEKVGVIWVVDFRSYRTYTYAWLLQLIWRG